MYLTKLFHIADHRLVMAGFPDDADASPRAKWSVLFRNDGDRTLVQSTISPDYSRVLPADKVQTRDHGINPQAGHSYRFRLAVNAIARYKGHDRKIDIDEWLDRRDFGCDMEIGTAVHDPVWEQSGTMRVYVNRWIVDGQLVVTNAETLAQFMASGIGRGRAWGCGLLSVIPTHSA